jgi:hypothetical protein
MTPSRLVDAGTVDASFLSLLVSFFGARKKKGTNEAYV